MSFFTRTTRRDPTPRRPPLMNRRSRALPSLARSRNGTKTHRHYSRSDHATLPALEAVDVASRPCPHVCPVCFVMLRNTCIGCERCDHKCDIGEKFQRGPAWLLISKNFKAVFRSVRLRLSYDIQLIKKYILFIFGLMASLFS